MMQPDMSRETITTKRRRISAMNLSVPLIKIWAPFQNVWKMSPHIPSALPHVVAAHCRLRYSFASTASLALGHNHWRFWIPFLKIYHFIVRLCLLGTHFSSYFPPASLYIHSTINKKFHAHFLYSSSASRDPSIIVWHLLVVLWFLRAGFIKLYIWPKQKILVV